MSNVARVVRSCDDENGHLEPTHLTPQRRLDAGSSAAKARREPRSSVAFAFCDSRRCSWHASEHRERHPAVYERRHVATRFELASESLVVYTSRRPRAFVIDTARRAQENEASHVPGMIDRRAEAVARPHRVSEKIKGVRRRRHRKSRVVECRLDERVGAFVERRDNRARSAVAREIDTQRRPVLVYAVAELPPGATRLGEAVGHHEKRCAVAVLAMCDLPKLCVKRGHDT